jgi:hypothetical protein
MATQITIEPTGTKDTGTCDCCGRVSRRVWGLAYAEGRCLAAYYVHWTLGHVPDRGANIDLILGEWGEATTSKDRRVLALAYRLVDTGPSMMVIDAQTRPASSSPLVGRCAATTSLAPLPPKKPSPSPTPFLRRTSASSNFWADGGSRPEQIRQRPQPDAYVGNTDVVIVRPRAEGALNENQSGRLVSLYRTLGPEAGEAIIGLAPPAPPDFPF